MCAQWAEKEGWGSSSLWQITVTKSTIIQFKITFSVTNKIGPYKLCFYNKTIKNLTYNQNLRLQGLKFKNKQKFYLYWSLNK